MCDDDTRAVIAVAHLEQLCQLWPGFVGPEHIHLCAHERLERVKDHKLGLHLFHGLLHLRAVEGKPRRIGQEVAFVQVAAAGLNAPPQDGQIILHGQQ